jgi:hypothetical protein
VAGILTPVTARSQVLQSESVCDAAARQVCLAVPPTLLKGALLAVEPAALQPVANPAEPAAFQPVANPAEPSRPVSKSPVQARPPSIDQFKQDLRSVIARSRCTACKGRGTIWRRKGVHFEGNQPVITLKEEWCPVCKGERLQWKDGTYAFFTQAARDGTALVLGNGAEADRKTACTYFGQLIASLAEAGDKYRSGFLKEMRADLAKEGATPPRGLCVFGQVRELLAGPDGPYVTIMPAGLPRMLAVRADGLLAIMKPDYDTLKSAKPAPGDWIILGGIADGQVRLGEEQPILVHPFIWVPGPSLGRFDAPAAGAQVVRTEPKPPKVGPIETNPPQPPPAPPEKEAGASQTPPPSPPPAAEPTGPKPVETVTSKPPPETPQPSTKPTGKHKDVEFFGL